MQFRKFPDRLDGLSIHLKQLHNTFVKKHSKFVLFIT